MTFYASDDKLATVGMEGTVNKINRNAVRSPARSRRRAMRSSRATSRSPGRTTLHRTRVTTTSGGSSIGSCRTSSVRAPGLLTGETFSFLGEALLFVERAKATGLPVMVTMSFEALPAKSYEGDAPGEAAKTATVSLTVTSGNAAPVVTITAPADGTRSPVGSQVAFAGTAQDAEQGNLAADLSWTSSIDGRIGSGPNPSKRLSEGTHTIRAKFTDAAGAIGRAAITVTIGNAAPEIVVTSPVDGTSAQAGTPVGSRQRPPTWRTAR